MTTQKLERYSYEILDKFWDFSDRSFSPRWMVNINSTQKVVNVGWVEAAKPKIFQQPQERQIKTSIISYASRLKYAYSKTPTL